MAKDDGKIEYEPRDQDTKSLAQRVVLLYLRRPHWFREWKTKLLWIAPAVAVAAMVPFLAGVGGTGKVFVNGEISRSHAVIESKCQSCHRTAFSKVRDQECQACHDGPVHQANANRQPSCAECHVEHRGNYLLREVSDGSCTGCHANLE